MITAHKMFFTPFNFASATKKPAQKLNSFCLWQVNNLNDCHKRIAINSFTKRAINALVLSHCVFFMIPLKIPLSLCVLRLMEALSLPKFQVHDAQFVTRFKQKWRRHTAKYSNTTFDECHCILSGDNLAEIGMPGISSEALKDISWVNIRCEQILIFILGLLPSYAQFRGTSFEITDCLSWILRRRLCYM